MPSPKTSQQREQLGPRNAILEAALRIIGEGGPDAITHRAVGARAGIPLGSVTYYFGSREELIREAFKFYVSVASRFLVELEQQMPLRRPRDLVDFLVEVARREFMKPEIVRAEYELILYAAKDALLAREFNAYENAIVMRLAPPLERNRVSRPLDAARTLIDLVRGFELERFTRPDADFADLRRRMLLMLDALKPSGNAKVPSNRAVRARSRVAARDLQRNPAPTKGRRM